MGSVPARPKRLSTKAQGGGEPVEYFVATPGLPGADVALLAGRGALLAHRRFRGRPGYTRWLTGSQAKVVLRASADEIAALARTHDALTIPPPPDTPLMAVFRPRSKAQAQFVAELKLYSGRIGPSVRVDWPATGRYVPIFVNGDLDLSAGKLAAQVGHSVLALLAAQGQRTWWQEWLALGMPIALLRTAGESVASLVESGLAHGERDEGRTEIEPGSLVAAAGSWRDLADWRPSFEVTLLAVSIGRAVAIEEAEASDLTE